MFDGSKGLKRATKDNIKVGMILYGTDSKNYCKINKVTETAMHGTWFFDELCTKEKYGCWTHASLRNLERFTYLIVYQSPIYSKLMSAIKEN